MTAGESLKALFKLHRNLARAGFSDAEIEEIITIVVSTFNEGTQEEQNYGSRIDILN